MIISKGTLVTKALKGNPLIDAIGAPLTGAGQVIDVSMEILKLFKGARKLVSRGNLRLLLLDTLWHTDSMRVYSRLPSFEELQRIMLPFAREIAEKAT